MSNFNITEDVINGNQKLIINVSGTTDKIRTFFGRAKDDINMMGKICGVNVDFSDDLPEEIINEKSAEEQMECAINDKIKDGQPCPECSVK